MGDVETISWKRWESEKGKRMKGDKNGVGKVWRESGTRVNERDSDYSVKGAKEVTKQFSYVVDTFTSPVGINSTLLFITTTILRVLLFQQQERRCSTVCQSPWLENSCRFLNVCIVISWASAFHQALYSFYLHRLVTRMTSYGRVVHLYETCNQNTGSITTEDVSP